MHNAYLNIKKFLHRYERYILPVSLIIGFIIDSITLTRIDRIFDNLVLISYLIIAGGSILLIYGLNKINDESLLGKFQTFLPFLLQYSFGGVFSGLFIFYSKSASIISNLPFLLILLFLLIGNEFFHRKNPRLVFWVSVFSVALLSYSVLIFPVLIKTLDISGFIGGFLIGILLVLSYIKLVDKIILKKKKEGVKIFYKTSAIIFSVFLILYATNMIPPVPLSVKDQGVFHSITRTNNTYIATGEKKDWFTPFRETNDTYNLVSGRPAYVFSSVFAPTEITGTIYHQWSYFENNRWNEISRLPISITGGREEGFRGYSWSIVKPGSWKVEIENSKGQVAGQLRFEVKRQDGPLNLIEKRY
jgi:hypothetical protein